MHRSAIGVFDSGIGGLTVAAEIARRLPHEDLIYLGDTARLPYGTRSAETVSRYADKAVSLLLRYPVKAVVIACNTATAVALPSLRALTDLPVFGVVAPGARAAVGATKSGRVGVVCTEGTLRSGAYQSAIRSLNPQLEVTAHAWPLLVPLAEEGWVEHPVARLTLRTYLTPLLQHDIDTLVLGCTHYPAFKTIIEDIIATEFPGRSIALVDSAQALTSELTAALLDGGLAAPERVGRRTFFCTDAPDRFRRVGGAFFSTDLSGVQVVDI
jgi:glutamate racemase